MLHRDRHVGGPHGGEERGVGQAVGQHKRQRPLECVVAQQRRVEEAAQQWLLPRIACRLLPATRYSPMRRQYVSIAAHGEAYWLCSGVAVAPLDLWAGHYHCRGTVPWLGSMTLCSSRAGAHSIACHTGLLGVTAEGLLRLCDCLRSISCPPNRTACANTQKHLTERGATRTIRDP